MICATQEELQSNLDDLQSYGHLSALFSTFGLIWFYIANNTEYNLVLCFENAPAQNQCYVRETTIQRLKSLEVLFSSESSSMSNEHLENFPKYCLRHDQGYAHVCKDHSKKPCDTT